MIVQPIAQSAALGGARKPQFSSNRIVQLVKSPQAREYGLIVGLNLVMTVAKTIMHGKAYANEGFSQEDRRLLNVQECVRQVISTVLWLTSLVVSYVITKRVFPNQSPMARILTTNLISSVPDAFVRPFLTAKIAKSFLGDDWNRQPGGTSQAAQPPVLVQQQPAVLRQPPATMPMATPIPYFRAGAPGSFYAPPPSAAYYYPPTTASLNGFYR